MEIKGLRLRLGLDQVQFGNLFGVHSMTVSRWERKILHPSGYQLALMAEFEKAAEAKKVRDTIRAVLIGAGVVAALNLLLQNARN